MSEQFYIAEPQRVPSWAAPYVTKGKRYPVLKEVTKRGDMFFHTELDNGEMAEIPWVGSSMGGNWVRVAIE
jgi:hypothetical protein